MEKYNIQITLSPDKLDSGRGSRRFEIEFDAESKEQAEEFARQYFDGFLCSGVKIIAVATTKNRDSE